MDSREKVKGLTQADHEYGTVLLAVSITNCVYGRGQDKDGLCHVLQQRSWCWTEHLDGFLIVLLPVSESFEVGSGTVYIHPTCPFTSAVSEPAPRVTPWRRITFPPARSRLLSRPTLSTPGNR
ncbi:unnamed protein product [Pleuronectes platessa]|uniref:Uncharacterized protein n=1 Tax=Pleuronectes platessa TaxID=8262 RepID=A0A9N7Y8N0_PLEPL|nr:unnamed protein product [Pleuronectes platessa]